VAGSDLEVAGFGQLDRDSASSAVTVNGFEINVTARFKALPG
jgi:hypothetical protein